MFLKLLFFVCFAICSIDGANIDRVGVERINGGDSADPANYGYHVAILYLDQESEHLVHLCGGAIIDSRYVLTAAHCVFGNHSSEIVVRAGGNQAPELDKPYLEQRVFRRVSQIAYPKNYFKDERYHEYDIAVLKIKGSFDLIDEEHFKKLYLPSSNADYVDKVAEVSGYGVHDPADLDGKLEGNNFKTLRTRVISTSQCQQSRAFLLTSGSLCTLSNTNYGHTCYGDGGDPLVYNNEIIGILNAPSSCDKDTPELFTKVSKYAYFVQKILNDEYAYDVVYA
ncbi:chymotrypsin-2-like [Trichogramma pretiosum]|uniref:chymotrypsin-2-like n=1 Tax=Trichogramma pretiosum TaxID=7493 RepID=UPI0006C9AC12|nr:chymotrypsin-2-like [Trichogramma pretiosum]